MIFACKRSCRRKVDVLIAASCWQTRPAGAVAAPLHEYHIKPGAIDVAEAFTIPNLAKSEFGVECPACLVWCEYLCLQRPIAFAFGNSDEFLE